MGSSSGDYGKGSDASWSKVLEALDWRGIMHEMGTRKAREKFSDIVNRVAN
jgi:hypothetical protein